MLICTTNPAIYIAPIHVFRNFNDFKRWRVAARLAGI
jgi:hypothetical protein